MDEDFEDDWNDFPEPLPPVRMVEVVRAESMNTCQCSMCLVKRGLLTCTSCKAVRYCGTACQKKQWKTHKQLCKLVKNKREETLAAAEPLKSLKLGGSVVDIFKENLGILEFDGEYVGGSGVMSAYDSARMGLFDALKKCGEVNNSKIASELAAENILDLMCLSYKGRAMEGIKEYVPGMLIAAEMDQQAYNYTRYFTIRGQVEHSLPYLHVDDQDIEEHLSKDQLYIREMVDIALIKYKRMKRLMFDEMEVEAGWKNFLMGTHPVVGEHSVVQRIRGLTPVIQKLQLLVYEGIRERISRLSTQVEELLTEVNSQNEFVLPGILDQDSIPPIDYAAPFGSLTEEEEEIDYKARDASIISEYSGGAWLRATVVDSYLEYFIHHGKVLRPEQYDRHHLLAYFGFVGLELNIDCVERARVDLYGNFKKLSSLTDSQKIASLEESIRNSLPM